MEAELPTSETLETPLDQPNTEQPGTEAVAQQAGSATEGASSGTPESWLTDEYRELAQSYGFDDEDLNSLSSADEFKKAARLFDRQIAKSVEQRRQHEQWEQSQKQAQQPEQPAAPSAPAKLSKLDMEKLKASGFDDETLNELKQLNDLFDKFEASEKEKAELREQTKRLNEEFGQVRQAVVQQQQAQWLNQFHDAVDSIGGDRYGKTLGQDGRPVTLNRAQGEARKKLHDTAETLAAGIRARGGDLPPLSVLLRRAETLAFSDDIAGEARRKVQQEITDQAKRRRPVATVRASNGMYASNKREPMTLSEKVQDIANNPAVDAAWKKALETSGAN